MSFGNTLTIGVLGSSVSSAEIDDDSIVDEDINSAAAIDATKIADGTVTDAEFQYVGDVTSLIQAQIDGKEGTLTNSAGLIAALSDETGTGSAVFATSPTLVTPVLGTPASGDLSNCTAAGAAQVGVVELATIAETDTGTDTGRALTPDGLAGSNIGTKIVQMVVVDFGTATATGDGKFYFHVPASLAGMNIVTVHAEVVTAGTTNTTDIQLHNVTSAADILSTKLTIDSGETGSDTAATAAVINTSEDDLTANDVIRVDVDAVSTTPANGLIVTLECQLP